MTLTRTLAWLAIALLAVVTAYGHGFFSGHEKGSEEQFTAAQNREQAVSLRHALALGAANARHRSAEAQLRDTAASAVQSLQRALTHEKSQNDRLLADVRAGAIRMSIPVASCGRQAGATGAGGDSAIAARDRHEARAELAPQTLGDLVAIATDGNAAIHQLNGCIDRYDEVRNRLNALRLPLAHPLTDDAQAQ